MTIRALIVDDEPLARDLLREMLAPHDRLEIVGECRDGAGAVAAIVSLTPDLVFLDVQMPGMSGLQVIEAVGPERMPRVVFVTAHDRYAAKAFELHALDYVLKPFDEDRLANTLRRVFASLAPDDLERRLAALLAGFAPAPGERLVIQEAGRALLVPVDEVDWLEAAGKYVVVHAGRETHTLRGSISALEAELDPRRFVRIHRSTIVRLDRIREIRGNPGGDGEVVLRDGTTLAASRSHRHRLHAPLGRRG